MYNQALFNTEELFITRLNQIYNFNIDLATVFNLYYLTGIRPAELYLMDEARRNLDNSWTIYTLKSNLPRTFSDTITIQFLDDNINRLITEAHFTRIQKIYRGWLKYYGEIYDFGNGRETDMYYLRYCYINRLLKDNKTPQEIKTILGHTKLTTTFAYINTILQPVQN